MRINIFSVVHMCMEEILPKNTLDGLPQQLTQVERLLDITASLALIDANHFELFLLENQQTSQQNQDPTDYNFCSYVVYLFCEGTASARFNIIALFTNLLNAEICQ